VATETTGGRPGSTTGLPGVAGVAGVMTGAGCPIAADPTNNINAPRLRLFLMTHPSREWDDPMGADAVRRERNRGGIAKVRNLSEMKSADGYFEPSAGMIEILPLRSSTA
jgi:hypothetical protein